MATLLAFILQIPIEVLQATALSDLPSATRYIIMAIAATMTSVLITYALAPPNVLNYCDKISADILNKLEVVKRSCEGLDPDVMTIENRLEGLDSEKIRLRGIVRGQTQVHLWRVVLSLPYLCAGLRLLNDYCNLFYDVGFLEPRRAVEGQRHANVDLTSDHARRGMPIAEFSQTETVFPLQDLGSHDRSSMSDDAE